MHFPSGHSFPLPALKYAIGTRQRQLARAKRRAETAPSPVTITPMSFDQWTWLESCPLPECVSGCTREHPR